MKDLESALRKTARRPAGRGAESAARRVASRAGAAGLLDVAYTFIDTPFGPFLAAVTPRGLVRLAFEPEPPEGVLAELAAKVSPRVLEEPGALDEVRRELDEYFEGKRTRFELSLDWRLMSGFRERVLRATAKIPYGSVATYREMATKAGNAAATRAAGSALGSNPIPIVVPCHRVLRTGGHLGGYGGGLEMKQALLRLEGAIAL
jgi:methylated-DNA-[protein]-cysteine S-methyltransferase